MAPSPPSSEVPPTTTTAMALRVMLAPTSAWPTASRDASIMPASVASAPVRRYTLECSPPASRRAMPPGSCRSPSRCCVRRRSYQARSHPRRRPPGGSRLAPKARGTWTSSNVIPYFRCPTGLYRCVDGFGELPRAPRAAALLFTYAIPLTSGEPARIRRRPRSARPDGRAGRALPGRRSVPPTHPGSPPAGNRPQRQHEVNAHPRGQQPQPPLSCARLRQNAPKSSNRTIRVSSPAWPGANTPPSP